LVEVHVLRLLLRLLLLVSLQLLLVQMSSRVWSDVLRFEIVCQLARNLGQNFLGELDSIFEISIGNELNDVSYSVLPISFGVEWLIVSVKRIHLVEIGIANTHNDYTQRKVRALDYLIASSIEIGDFTVSNDQKNLELLVALTDL